MNFLAAHECGIGFREFRGAPPTSEAESETMPVYPGNADSLEVFAGCSPSRVQ